MQQNQKSKASPELGPPNSAINARLGRGLTYGDWQVELEKLGHVWTDGLRKFIIKQEYLYFKDEIGALLSEPSTGSGRSSSTSCTNILRRLKGETGEREWRLQNRRLFNPEASKRTIQLRVEQWEEEDSTFGKAIPRSATAADLSSGNMQLAPNDKLSDTFHNVGLRNDAHPPFTSHGQVTSATDPSYTVHGHPQQNLPYNPQMLIAQQEPVIQEPSFNYAASVNAVQELVNARVYNPQETLYASEYLLPSSNGEQSFSPYFQEGNQDSIPSLDWERNETPQPHCSETNSNTFPNWSMYGNFIGNEPTLDADYPLSGLGAQLPSNVTNVIYAPASEPGGTPSVETASAHEKSWLDVMASQDTVKCRENFEYSPSSYAGDTEMLDNDAASLHSFDAHGHSLPICSRHQFDTPKLHPQFAPSPGSSQNLRTPAKNTSKLHLFKTIRSLRLELEKKDAIILEKDNALSFLAQRLKMQDLNSGSSDWANFGTQQHRQSVSQGEYGIRIPVFDDNIDPEILQQRCHDKIVQEAQLGKEKRLSLQRAMEVPSPSLHEEKQASSNRHRVTSSKALLPLALTSKSLSPRQSTEFTSKETSLPLRSRPTSHENGESVSFSAASKRASSPIHRIGRKLSDRFMGRHRDPDDHNEIVPPIPRRPDIQAPVAPAIDTVMITSEAAKRLTADSGYMSIESKSMFNEATMHSARGGQQECNGLAGSWYAV